MEHLGINKNFKPTTQNECRLIELLEKKHEEVTQLCKKIELLEKNFEEIKSEKNKNQNKEEATVSDSEYHTEDEQLSYDVEWIRQKNKKEKRLEKRADKRKADESLSPRADRNYLPLKSKQEEKKETSPKKAPSPPPIMVDEVNNIEELRLVTLKDVPKNSYRIKILNNRKIKINVDSADDYKTITKALLENEKHWFTFENKHERPYRVMVKKLHHSSLPEHIVEDLKEQGFKVLNAVNKVGWHSKEKLDMFILSFDSNEDIEKIKNIKIILNQIVEVENLRKNKLLVQCKKCQSFGHSQNYCAKEPRCVKCAGKHFTKDCTKIKEDPAKCVLCGEAHPANYRGCTVAKELQLMKNKSNVVAGKSYAQVAAKGKKEEARAQPITNTVAQTLENILLKLNSFDERLKKIENSAKGAIPKTNK